MTNDLRPPAHIAPYVEVLGVDLAVDFLLTFGGAELYWAKNPRQSRLTELVGVEKAAALAVAAEAARLHPRIPLAHKWVAQVMYANHLPIAEISRRLHKSDTAVRKYISAETRADTRQLSLPI
jgi:hypothetical protein